MRIAFVWIFLLMLLPDLATPTMAGTRRYQQTDLSGRIVSTAGREPAVLQFEILPADSGSYLAVRCESPFAMFREGVVLASSVRSLRWSVDSLRRMYGAPLTLAMVRQQQGPWTVFLEKPVPVDPLDPGLRTRGRFTEFAVITGAMVVFYLLVILISSMRNVQDYLALTRAFITSAREDKPTQTRITATPAMLMYGFFVLTVSYTLTLYTSPSPIEAGFVELTGEWLRWLVVIAVVFIIRVVLVAFLSYLYSIRDAVELQITGLVRSGLLACLFLCAVLAPLLWVWPDGIFRHDLLIWCWLVVQLFYLGTLFGRLKRLTGAKPLHLFFYLCVSEFIPLVYLVTTF